MTGSPIDIDRLAALARIEIDARESAVVQQKLGAIFGLVEALQAVDTDGVVPMAHAHDVAAPLREDRVTEPDQHATFQGLAPSVEGGLYLVPRVIE